MNGRPGTGKDSWWEGGPPPRLVVRSVLRALGFTIGLVAIYYVLPFDRISTWPAVVMLAIGLLTLIGLIVFQVRKIIQSPFPGLLAVEALATSIPLFLLLFAGTYLVLSTASPGNFNHELTHSRALYFTVTVFSTEGFGDIRADSDAARLVITGQMIADLVILGVALKVVVGAVKRGHQRRAESDPGR
jgi:ion channel